MGWFNGFGLLLIVAILIPNLIFAIRCKDGFANKQISPRLETAEQIGRFGCFGLMILNIPGPSSVRGRMRHCMPTTS